jgi:hypothetical protein
VTLDFSFGQWPFLMRAGIFEGKERPLDVEERYLLALMFTSRAVPGVTSLVSATFTNSAMHSFYIPIMAGTTAPEAVGSRASQAVHATGLQPLSVPHGAGDRGVRSVNITQHTGNGF